MKISVCVATYNAKKRQEPYEEAIACFNSFADEVIEIDDVWPEEFSWPFIGEIFQRGYERATGDWVLRFDLDYFLHENDFEKLREALAQHSEQPALSLYKRQFVLVDRFNLKARVVCAMNKGKFGNKIRMNSGGDLCAPSLLGKEIKHDEVPEAKVPIYNYDFSFKQMDTVKRDFSRFARAWQRHFGDFRIGGPDEDSAFEYFLRMQLGKVKKPSEKIQIKDHPKFIYDKIASLTKDEFGHSLWGNYDKAEYYK